MVPLSFSFIKVTFSTLGDTVKGVVGGLEVRG